MKATLGQDRPPMKSTTKEFDPSQLITTPGAKVRLNLGEEDNAVSVCMTSLYLKKYRFEPQFNLTPDDVLQGRHTRLPRNSQSRDSRSLLRGIIKPTRWEQRIIARAPNGKPFQDKKALGRLVTSSGKVVFVTYVTPGNTYFVINFGISQKREERGELKGGINKPKQKISLWIHQKTGIGIFAKESNP
jgi:hypothetical protein